MVFARESKGPGRGKQRLPLALPAARVLQQIRGAGKVQILDPERETGGNESDGIPAGVPVRAGQGLGLQEVHPAGLSAGRGERAAARGQTHDILRGQCSRGQRQHLRSE
uniref:(northern house mosquito) hypothetical protein n=1 Tax=Culex pipiens TaxID=7175 RepID=A0A8D8NXZ1_CULPI